FGLKRGVGAETLSEFFGRLRLEAHVGCSPSALRSVMHNLERIILETAAAWEQEGIAHGEIRPVIGAVDETFLQRMMLVFMDLASGYVLMEAVAVDRSYQTWYSGVNERLQTFGIGVLYLVSEGVIAPLPRSYAACCQRCVPFAMSTWVAGWGFEAKYLWYTSSQTPLSQMTRRSKMTWPPVIVHAIPERLRRCV